MYFGVPAFKLARLGLCLIIIVHMLACGFYRVKSDSASAADLADFFLSRNADPQASRGAFDSPGGPLRTDGVRFNPVLWIGSFAPFQIDCKSFCAWAHSKL